MSIIPPITTKTVAAGDAETNRRLALSLVDMLRTHARAEPSPEPPAALEIRQLDSALLVELVDELTRTQAKPPQPPRQDILDKAERILAGATEGELVTAEFLYRCYGAVSEGRSAITGAELPAFAACPPLVRACWVSTARGALELGGKPAMGDASGAPAGSSRGVRFA